MLTSSQTQTPTPSTTTTLTATPTQTQTPTPTNVYQSIQLSTPQSDSCTACRLTTYSNTGYVSAGDSTPTVNDVVYTNTSLTNPWNGASQWWKTSWGGNLYAIQINASGVIISIQLCSACPTQTQTPTPSVTASQTNTPTPSITASQTQTPTPSITASQTQTPTPSITASQTQTPTPSITASQTQTPTPSIPTSLSHTLVFQFQMQFPG